VYKLIRQGGG